MAAFLLLGRIERRYAMMSAAAGVLFLFVLVPEAAERSKAVWSLLQEAQSDEKPIPHDELGRRAGELALREEALRSFIRMSGSHFEQSRTGVFEFLSNSARSAGVAFESLKPGGSEGSGPVTAITFTATLQADYHRIGAFVSSLESGPIPVRIETIELARNERPGIATKLTGRAYIVPG